MGRKKRPAITPARACLNLIILADVLSSSLHSCPPPHSDIASRVGAAFSRPRHVQIRRRSAHIQRTCARRAHPHQGGEHSGG